jgi:hypothetical protein
MTDNPFSRDAQRYLDGGPHGELSEAERRAADDLLAAATAYRDALPALDARVDAAVLAELRQPRPGTRGWRWIVTARVRPVWIPLAAAAAAAAVWVAGPRRPADLSAPPRVVAAAPDTVFVQFQLAAPGAHSVAVAGSFNGWDPAALQMVRAADGTWITTIALPVGEHSYQFVLDGQQWRPDPTAHAQVEDGFGGTNSVIVVGRKGLVRT